MSFIDFRNVSKKDRDLMGVESPAALRSLESAEARSNDPLWILKSDFTCLKSMAAERPSGPGQIFRF